MECTKSIFQNSVKSIGIDRIQNHFVCVFLCVHKKHSTLKKIVCVLKNSCNNLRNWRNWATFKIVSTEANTVETKIKTKDSTVKGFDPSTRWGLVRLHLEENVKIK